MKNPREKKIIKTTCKYVKNNNYSASYPSSVVFDAICSLSYQRDNIKQFSEKLFLQGTII